jgi:Skp family chaperone for outer membrane proteins
MIDDELKVILAAMRTENADRFDAIHQENAAMRAENAAAHTETRRHFDAVAERLETRFELLAETVQAINEKVDRSVDRLDKKIDETAAETQAMIRFSHDGLHRRVTALEAAQGIKK